MVDKRKGYNLTKALCIRGKSHKLIEYEGRCRMKSNNGSGDPQWSWGEYRYPIRGRKNANATDYGFIWIIQSLNAKELWFPKQGIRSRRSDQGWINCIYQRHNQRQIVWSRTSSCSKWRLSRKDNPRTRLMIVNIHNVLNQRTQKWWWQRMPIWLLYLWD